MKISQVVITMGRKEIAQAGFVSNFDNCGRIPDEIVWIDNGSVDGMADFAREHADICVLNRKNLGVAHAFNTAYALATGDVIVTMQPYSKAPNNWLKAMSEVYEASGADGVCLFHIPVDSEAGRIRGDEETHAGYRCRRTLFIEHVLFGKSALDKFGYMDEFLDPYWPCDVEYAFRVDHHGFRALAIYDLMVEHCGRGKDIEPFMPSPSGNGTLMPYWEWKKAVQWRPEVHARIHANSEAGWPRYGLNQKPM